MNKEEELLKGNPLQAGKKILKIYINIYIYIYIYISIYLIF